MNKSGYFRVLTIAGSDSSGGAGIQADLKTFSALGCYGMSVITALTAQNTHEVRGILNISPDFVRLQLDAVLEDIEVDAVKIGMLSRSDIIQVVVELLQKHSIENIVVDPVMISKSGDKLLQSEAINTMRSLLFPIATVVTPNLPEISVLLNREISKESEMEDAGRELCCNGSFSVVVKGGHLEGGRVADCLITEQEGREAIKWFTSERISSKNTHGTGCTFSAAIAAFLARGESLVKAVELAKVYITKAIAAGANKSLGNGHGPVNHFWEHQMACNRHKERFAPI